MYTDLTKPLVDYSNAQVQSLARFTQSRDIAELTRSSIENFWQLVQDNQSRFVQSDALKELTKANVENLSRLLQEYSRSFSALAYEAQGQLTRGIQAGTKRFQQVANTASNIVGNAADESTEALKGTAEEIADETDDVTKARGRRRG
jgi:histone H3/H4